MPSPLSGKQLSTVVAVLRFSSEKPFLLIRTLTITVLSPLWIPEIGADEAVVVRDLRDCQVFAQPQARGRRRQRRWR
jgi:hypothetical protein